MPKLSEQLHDIVELLQQIDKKLTKKRAASKRKPSALPGKIRYGETIHLRKDQYDNLAMGPLGVDGAAAVIKIVDEYKLRSGTKYESDYHAILSWGIRAYEEAKAKGEMIDIKKYAKPAPATAAANTEEARWRRQQNG